MFSFWSVGTEVWELREYLSVCFAVEITPKCFVFICELGSWDAELSFEVRWCVLNRACDSPSCYSDKCICLQTSSVLKVHSSAFRQMGDVVSMNSDLTRLKQVMDVRLVVESPNSTCPENTASVSVVSQKSVFGKHTPHQVPVVQELDVYDIHWHPQSAFLDLPRPCVSNIYPVSSD